MTPTPHLNNAPIREAVIDIRANLSRKIRKEDLDEIRNELDSGFPDCKEIMAYGGKISFQANTASPVVQAPQQAFLGFRFDSSDGKHVLQIRNNGFTFSRLAPYTDWESVKRLAEKYWNWYKSFRAIDHISRLAVRYINRINVPFPANDLSAYLKAPPSLPEGAPESLDNFFTKVSVRYPKDNMIANIIHALERADEKTGVQVVLDIDVFTAQKGFDDEKVWESLAAMRKRKNEIFFGSLHEKALEQYR